MAATKRDKHQREHDYKLIAELYLQGWYQVDIAQKIGVSQGQISQDLKVIRRRWREDTAIDFDEALLQELARISQLERTFWESWYASFPRDKNGKELENATGNTRHLNGVKWCITERCKILGLYAPEKALTGIADVRSLSDDELRDIVDGS